MVLQSLAGARRAGHDVGRLLRESGIAPRLVSRPEARVRVDRFARLTRCTSALMQDELYGLLSRPVPLGATRFMAYAMLHTETVHGALQRCVEFNRLFDNSLRYELRVDRSSVRLELHRVPGQEVLNSFAIEASLAFPHRLAGWLANERIILDQVEVDCGPPDYVAEYRGVFYGAPVLFGRTCSSIQFDRGYLDRPIVQTESSLDIYLGRVPLDTYMPLHANGRMTLDVRNRAMSSFERRGLIPEFERVAAELDVHPQALRRRLKREGSSYRSITNHIRRDAAIHHLGTRRMSIEEVAERTGYSEPSAFIRAFKSWTGLTPLSFRKGLLD